MDLGIAVQAADRGEHLAAGHVSGEVNLLGVDAHVRAGLVLGANVDARGLIVAHQDRGEARCHAVVGERLDSLGHLGADLGSDGAAVEDASGHGPGCYRLTTAARGRRCQEIGARNQCQEINDGSGGAR